MPRAVTSATKSRMQRRYTSALCIPRSLRDKGLQTMFDGTEPRAATFPPLREVGSRRESRPRFRRRLKMQTAPGIPEAVARTDKSVPHQGHPYYRDNAATNQVTSRRVAPRPANPPLVPERQSFQRRNGPGGIRTVARTLTGSCAAITPQAHEPKLTSVVTRIPASILHLLKQSFVLGNRLPGWSPFFILGTGDFHSEPCDVKPCHPQGLQPIIVKPETAESTLGII